MRESSSGRLGAADVEVTLVESHANLKILSRRRPRQLLKLVAGFQSLQLTILHLNVTTIEDMVLYSISAKVVSSSLFLPSHLVLVLYLQRECESTDFLSIKYD